MFCPNCGTQLNDNAKFCSKCGAKTESAGAAEAPRPSPPPPPPISPEPHQQYGRTESRPESAPMLGDSTGMLDPMECIRSGWGMVKSNLGIFVLGAIIVFAINAAMSFIPIAGQIASIFLMPLNAGLIIMAFKAMNGSTPEISDIFSGYKRFGDSLLVQLVTGIFIGLGFVLCIAPGVYLAVCYMLALPLVIDSGMGFWDAMTLSMAEIRRQWMSFFVLALLLLLVILAGALALGVGMLVAIPVCACATASAYKQTFPVKNNLP